MALDDVGLALGHAHKGHYLVRVRAVNRSGNTVDIVGYVTAIRDDGRVRITGGDPEQGHAHDFQAERILAVERLHGA
jgi:hypothetical protein